MRLMLLCEKFIRFLLNDTMLTHSTVHFGQYTHIAKGYCFLGTGARLPIWDSLSIPMTFEL